MTRRCNSRGRLCGFAIQPLCEQDNILWVRRLLEFTEVFEDTDTLKIFWVKNGSLVALNGQKARSDFSTRPSGHIPSGTCLSSQRPARKMSKNYVVPDYLVLTNIILQNKHISCRQRVV